MILFFTIFTGRDNNYYWNLRYGTVDNWSNAEIVAASNHGHPTEQACHRDIDFVRKTSDATKAYKV